MRDLSYMDNASWWQARYKHGGYSNGKEHPTHYIWRTMIARCTNPSSKNYDDYGKRGIKVCDRWLLYDNFLDDMGVRPDGKSLDRIDNNGNYEPGNCRWSTRSEQQKNKRSTRIYKRDRDGFVGTLVEVSEMLGVSKSLASWRFKVWVTFEKGEIWHELQRG